MKYRVRIKTLQGNWIAEELAAFVPKLEELGAKDVKYNVATNTFFITAEAENWWSLEQKYDALKGVFVHLSREIKEKKKNA